MGTPLAEHPTVKWFQGRATEGAEAQGTRLLDADWLRRLCLEAGADDVGFVSLDRPEVADQRADILAVFPAARTLVSFVCRMNREPIRSPARSVANVEFHRTGDHVNAVGHRIVAALEQLGVRALNPAMGFPMEMDRHPGKIWVVSHKPVAVAAGLGHMGIHRNLIHPRFGSFVLLGTVLVGADVTTQGTPLDYNPCLSCKLCVAACPVGAIGPDGDFGFSACATHNYKEFLGGFTNWVGEVAASRDSREYRRRVSDSESASVWQSLSFGANYKAAYCLAVCPAGEDVIGPFLTDRPGFLRDVVRPLQDKAEPVYVTAGSDAEAHVSRRYPHKTVRRVRSPLRATSINALFRFGLRLTFQRGRSEGLTATYHFAFSGREPGQWTVIIRDKAIQVSPGAVGTPDLRVTADSDTWLKIANKELNVVWALLRFKVRVRGPLRLLRAFGRCFPG